MKFFLAFRWCRVRLFFSYIFFLSAMIGSSFYQTHGATLTVKTNKLGTTPEVLAYNSGHFYPGSNTKDWWHYSGVGGVRFFVAPNDIEATDDIAGRGDGVITQADFVNRRAALRANPLSPTYINWSYFTNRYETHTFSGNIFRVNYAFSQERALNLKILVNISATFGSFTISDSNDWAGKWELWQHYYAQAFYLGREFDVMRYQMFNEPNHSSAGGLTPEQYLERLQLASDAIQSALADVNQIYGKFLTPLILSPVLTTSSYIDWSATVVTNRHLNYLGQIDPSFSLIQKYDYHEYNSTPSSFGSHVTTMRNTLASVMSPEPGYPVTITEFNVHTAGTFATLSETLDSPTKYSRFGAIAVNLMKNICNEMYCFKFSQTSDGTGEIKKNGMHYVENNVAPYNIGTITKAGEVWRLFNKAFATGRDRLDFTLGTGADVLDVQASYDGLGKKYYLFSANDTTSPVNLDINLSAWNIPTGNQVLIEEVSESCYGAVKIVTNLPAGSIISATQPANTAWLLSVAKTAQDSVTNINASDDAMVSDGANKSLNFGLNTTCFVRNNSTNADGRYASFLKFHLPAFSLTNLQNALLTLRASSINGSGTVWAHVYGITNNSWTQNAVTWASAPNLAQNISPGSTIPNNFLLDAGDSAEIVGQLVAGASPADRTIDVTKYLREHPGADVSFLLLRPVGFSGDAQDNDGISIVSKEGSSTTGPRLSLVFNSTNLPPNNPPVAVEDYAFTTQAVAVAVNALANDSDPDSDVLSIQSFTQGANGSVATNGTGKLVYTPNAGFYGNDEFLYTINDGRSGTASASVQVTIYSSFGTQLISTNIVNSIEANIQSGSFANTDVDEATAGYVIIKYYTTTGNLARKAYFQFDFTGLNLNINSPATFKINSTNAYRVQLWGLNQEYPGFNSSITWNTAQANDVISNDLLTSGALTAVAINSSVFLSTGVNSITVPRLGDFLFNNRVTLVLSAVDDAANNGGGMRIKRMNASLVVSANVPAPVPVPVYVTGIVTNANRTVTLQFLGTSNQTYFVQAAGDPLLSNWLTISTNVAAANGAWSFTDLEASNLFQRFYRVKVP
ncbi:MAG: Ig-like domain-containing protein [Verrucomicrobiota bacterium]